MKTKGITLIELQVAMVIAGIVGLTIATYYMVERRFRNIIERNIFVSREARIAMNHMTRVFRFAEPASGITTTNDAQGYPYIIEATIDKGHITPITNDTDVRYTHDTTNEKIIFTWLTSPDGTIPAGTQYDVAENIPKGTYNIWAWSDPELTLRLGVSEDQQDIYLQSLVRPIGE